MKFIFLSLRMDWLEPIDTSAVETFELLALEETPKRKDFGGKRSSESKKQKV